MQVSTTTPDVAPELLSLREAARLCGVSDRTLWTWSHNGTAPPALKIGKGVVRYPRAAYVAWVAAGCPRMNGGRNDES